MTVDISTQRLFSLPCFEGLRLFRNYRNNYRELSLTDLLELIDSVEADAPSLDMQASVCLSSYVEEDCPMQGPFFYQSCIKAILLKRQPIWSKVMRSGRKRFVNSLNPDDRDVFVAAGLMDDPPSVEVVTWWDEVSGLARVISDRAKIEQGREAEVLTLEHERSRLNAAGIVKEPEWPGLDDNFAGYDVLSYDPGPMGVVNRLIEVKSTTASPLRFIISRNEWRKAAQSGKAYIFHIWDMNRRPPVLHTRTVAEVAPHIPSDNGIGKWINAEVPLATPLSTDSDPSPVSMLK